MAGVFVAGFREFSRLRRQAGIGAAELLEAAAAMRVAQLRETDRLEETSHACDHRLDEPVRRPLRTVWGIMSAFQGLGNVQQATLAMVGPASPRPSSPRRWAVRGHSRVIGLQPLRRPSGTAGASLRRVHGGILHHLQRHAGAQG